MQILEAVGALVALIVIIVGAYKCLQFLFRGNPPAFSGEEVHEHDAGKTEQGDGSTNAAAE